MSELPDLAGLSLNGGLPPVTLQLVMIGDPNDQQIQRDREVVVDSDSMSHLGPISVPPLGKGFVVLTFEGRLDATKRIKTLTNFDFAKAAGALYEVGANGKEDKLFTDTVQLVALDDGYSGHRNQNSETRRFKVRYTWPDDGPEKLAGRTGFWAVGPRPPHIKLVLTIPLRG
jgi:hypothetical protein